VSRLTLAITFLFSLIALCLFESVLHFGIRTKLLSELPFLNRPIHFVCAVVSPAHELRNIRRIGRDAAGVFEGIDAAGRLLIHSEHGLDAFEAADVQILPRSVVLPGVVTPASHPPEGRA